MIGIGRSVCKAGDHATNNMRPNGMGAHETSMQLGLLVQINPQD